MRCFGQSAVAIYPKSSSPARKKKPRQYARGGVNYFRDLWRLREARTALVIDLGESLAEGYDIDRRRVHAFSKSKEEDARSGFVRTLLVIGTAIFMIVFLTHGSEPCAAAFDDVRKLVSFRRKYFCSAMRINQTYALKRRTV